MLIKDFEKKIQDEIEPTLSIRTNPNHEDIAGVYWGDIYLGVAVPPVEIRETAEAGYTDKYGYPYKARPFAEELIKGKLAKFKKAKEEEPELFTEQK